MLPSELIVLLAGRRIGVVRRAAGDRLSFVYDDAWRDANDAYPLSLSLPLIEREHGDAPVRAYLEGLLPDRAEVRESWAKRFKVSSRNAYGLVAHVGEDCPGAVQFVTEASEALVGATESPRTWLSDADIAERLRNSVQVYSTGAVVRKEGYFSLAGAQPNEQVRGGERAARARPGPPRALARDILSRHPPSRAIPRASPGGRPPAPPRCSPSHP